MSFYFVFLMILKEGFNGCFEKCEFGLGMICWFKLFVCMKGLCGIVFDIFGCIEECKMECVLIK